MSFKTIWAGVTLVLLATPTWAGVTFVADAANDSRVSVFGRSGELISSFFAYDRSFAGGVRVASGDVNGDGFDDLIAAPGAGGGPLRVIDGTRFGRVDADGVIAASAVYAEFFAFDASFTGGVRVATGDINNDGHVDIITAAGPGGGPHVRVFDGASAATSLGNTLLSDFFAYDPVGFAGGVRVAAGDVNGDGTADIITGPGAGGGPHVRVWDSTRVGLTPLPQAAPPGSLLAELQPFGPTFSGGIQVAVGDINGDGFADVITGAGTGGGPHVRVFDGLTGTSVRSWAGFDSAFTGGVFVAAGDVNGDGRADVVMGSGVGGSARVRMLSGATGPVTAQLPDSAYLASLAGSVNGSAVAFSSRPVPAPGGVVALVALGLLGLARRIRR